MVVKESTSTKLVVEILDVDFLEIVELNEEGLELFGVVLGLLSVVGLLPLMCTLVVEFDKFDEIVEVTEVLGSNPGWLVLGSNPGRCSEVTDDVEFEDNFDEELVF